MMDDDYLMRIYGMMLLSVYAIIPLNSLLMACIVDVHPVSYSLSVTNDGNVPLELISN